MRNPFFPLSVIGFRFQSEESKRISSDSTMLPYLTILPSKGGMAALNGEQAFDNFTKWDGGLKMRV
jgi:hypothetical protein